MTHSRFRAIPGVVIALGAVSFLTDLSSEMIYPLLPVFLTTVLGAGAISLGIIEGIAEATASVLKVLSGLWADRVARRKPLVLAGYTLASIARPLIGLATGWPFVLAMRFTDRIGKGLRSSPRDALIADSVDPANRGRAFGFQRAMDHAGAVLGPIVAALLMSAAGLPLRTVFLLAGIPAALVIIVLIFGVHETPRARTAAPGPDTSRADSGALRAGSWHDLGPGYHRYLFALLVFTLGNSTDAFILLRLTEGGVSAPGIALLWSLHHIVKMTASYFGGSLSDRAGRKRLVLAGWLLYALVYLGFGVCDGVIPLIGLFLVYGIYFGLTEPVERAWAVDLVPRQRTGAALGYYHGAVGIAALPASVLFGFIWKTLGAPAAFTTGALLAFTAALLLTRVPSPNP